ncbi:hypothetical protein PQX77_005974 [Marasmius sp. AFHP31]|nr:hypothetical protein PQX77_005974 [Marasmius sp. AFHP31]
MAAILGMPIAVLVRRDDYDSCIAWVLFSGSSAGTVTTVAFIYVLLRFPDFMRRVKAEGAEPDVVVRLATFYQLNVIRIVFRFMFNFTLLTLALDGIQGTHAIARTVAASDVLSMLGGIGCFVSSAITLLIFFPRSITRESGYKAKLSSSPSVEDPQGERLASPLPHYSRHARNASSPKSPATADGHWAQSPQMGPFRLTNGNGSDYSLGSYNPNHRPARTASYPSHRRYSSDDEATPGYYESDPEVPVRRYSSRRRKGNGGGGGGADDRVGGDEMIWEMQRPEEMVAAYRRRRPPSRPRSQGDRYSSGAPPSFDHRDSYKGDRDLERDGDVLKGNVNGRDSAVVILPSDGPLALEEGMTFPSLSHRSSFVHPYVMNFTSPIDLLDATDKDNDSTRGS